VVHELYEDPEVVAEVRERFGAGVIAGDGTVDRGAVATAAVAAPDGREWLEGLLWPRVGARMAAWREAALASDPAPAALVVEVPLLFESGMDGAFDATIAVVAPEALRAERAGARGHEALAERGARQMPQDEKAARATHAVVNDGDVAALERKLSAVLATLSG
jgi:dephospho-CoA kinase